MTARLATSDAEAFRTVVAERLGLNFDESKSALLAEVLRARLAATAASPEAYLQRLASASLAMEEIRALAPELTVAETYFFRGEEQFRALERIVLPERVSARLSTRKLRVLSAGCASGEEPYSLAIFMREHLPDPAWEASILGVDLNPVVLARARIGRYSAWSLRETPEATRIRWFEPLGRDFLLDASIVQSVQFAERNLHADDPFLWQPGAYDFVFCRNVLMYATREAAQSLLRRIAVAMAPGGYLFLGHAETLRGLSADFQAHHSHGAFFYQRTSDRLLPAPAIVRTVAPRATAATALVATPGEQPVWASAIDRSRARIERLWRAPLAGASSVPFAPPVAPNDATIEAARTLLERERFTESLELLRGVPEHSTRHAEVLLLTAVALTHQAQFLLAERACAELLALDEHDTGALYLLALCREGVGDMPGAIAHDERAILRDPAFVFPRLHLGLLARRAGDRETARRELGQALELLQSKGPLRLPLFGGGFSREGLRALCQAELAGCGGAE